MRYRLFVIPAAGVIVLLGGFLFFGLNDNLVYYQTPSEAVQQRAEFPDGDRFRLGGQVAEGSLAETADGVSFIMSDGAVSIEVEHRGTPPQLFQEGIVAIVEGAWQGDRFESDTLIVKHDEEYRVPTTTAG